MAEIGFREAGRRYRRLFWPVMLVYAVVCIGGALIYKSMDEPAPWISTILAVLSAAPVVAVFWLLARFIRETDEYTRMIQTSAMVSGGAIVFSVAIVWGFLELYEAIPPMTFFPAILLVAPGFLTAYGLSLLAGALRRGETLREAIKTDPLCATRGIPLMSEVTYKGANRRYRRLFIPVMTFYVVFCFVGPLLMMAYKGFPPTWLMAVVSVISGAPIAIVFWLIGRYLRETDEFTRQIQLDALLPAAGITLSLAVIWGFLELYQVVPRAKIFSPMMMVGPAFFFFYGTIFTIQRKLRGESLRDAPHIGSSER